MDITSRIAYNHIEIGDIRNTRPFRICGALKQDGEWCQSAAGRGTGHPGEGRCIYHGGGAGSGPVNGHYKTGRYAKSFHGRLRQHYEQIEDSDENPVDIIPELKAVQALFSFQLDEFSGLMSGLTASQAKQEAAARMMQTLPRHLFGGPSAGYDRKLKARNSAGDSTGEGSGMEGNSVEKVSADIPLSKFSISTPQEAGLIDAEQMSSLVLTAPPDADAMTRVNLQKLGALLETSRQISDMIQKIVTIRNNTAYTKAEVMFILSVLQDAMNEFVPKDRHKEYVDYLKHKSGDILGKMMGEGNEAQE